MRKKATTQQRKMLFRLASDMPTRLEEKLRAAPMENTGTRGQLTIWDMERGK